MKRSSSPFANFSRPEAPRVTTLEQLPTELSGIYKLGASVVDLIPHEERARHVYWRGASLGAVAYNLIHFDRLNTARNPDDPHMHFATGRDAYGYADQIARSITQNEGYAGIQFPDFMRTELAYMADASPHAPTPGIVFALHPELNDYVLRPSDRGANEGVVWDGAVTLDMIDNRTRSALEQILSNY